MSQLRYLFLVCSIAFFACTNDVAGTWEDENTLALQSSSDITESSSSAAESSAESSSSTIDTIPLITSSSYTIYVVIEQYGNEGKQGCGIEIIEYKGNITTSTSSSDTTLIINGKSDTTISSSASSMSNLITLNNVLEGRIAELTKSGLT
jgi:hypothetical protein